MTLSSMVIDVIRLSVWLLLLALLFVPLEWLFSLHERRGRWRFANLAYYFLNSLLPASSSRRSWRWWRCC
ncbi:hypothetical protein QP166_08865 [Sphingomonas sp. LR60]|uniref:hypothetical protein n=1 Tax=Sphingomonas sp. LR60 TaxID=3050233 RepID=UPI002FE1FBFD